MSLVTMQEVAQSAGVSLKTVSRVINEEKYVNPVTRSRVLDVIEKLKFTPNLSARALASTRSYVLSLYLDNPSASYLAEIEHGAMTACRQLGYHLLIEKVEDRGPALYDRVIAQQRAVRQGGVILPCPLADLPELLDALDVSGVKYVRISPAADLDRSPYVHIDDRQAAYDMTAYLQGLGHRDIGFISGPAGQACADLRQQGFIEAMADAGLPVPHDRVQQGAFSFRSGWDAAERLLGGRSRPTAIFASNDDMALGVMAVANRLKIDIPSQLTLTGFDDSPSARVVWPQLTTVRQPVSEMAAVATELLVESADGGRKGTSRLLPFELVVRQSSGPPAKA
jgi:LacI family transcriptional regulator